MVRLIKTYLVKMFRGALVSAGALALIGGSVLCCCFVKTVEAAPKKNCCQKDAHQKADPVKTCDHCQIRSVDSGAIVQVFDAVPVFVKYVLVSLSADWVADRSQIRYSTHLACAGPPSAYAKIPIYLQFSNLRL